MSPLNPRDAVFHPEFREDLRRWIETDRRTAMRALKIVEEILRDPFRGIGKPEPLKHLGKGLWSRRLTQEHRIVYLVGEGSDRLPAGPVSLLMDPPLRPSRLFPEDG